MCIRIVHRACPFARGQPLLLVPTTLHTARTALRVKARKSGTPTKASLLSCHGGSFLTAEQKSELEEVAELIGQAGKVRNAATAFD